jgi:hypothetical protein
MRTCFYCTAGIAAAELASPQAAKQRKMEETMFHGTMENS